MQALSCKLYHGGIKKAFSRSTLAEADESRDWRIYADYAQILIKEARKLYMDDSQFKVDIEEIAYALDSSIIDLCLSMFPRAKFRKSKGAVKIHALMDLRVSIPTFVEITDGKYYDVKILDLIQTEPGAIYVMDMAYIDNKRLCNIHQRPAWFVTRAKTNMDYKRVYSRPVDKTTGLLYDESILWHKFQCCLLPNMESHLHIFAGGNH